MGSMRNPVGPLPSSIYWRRRAVAGLLVALIAVLIAWAVTSGGGGGGGGDDAKPGGSDPVESITPGPGSSGPAISQQPGGRDESDDEDGSGGSGGSGGSSGGSADGGASDGSSAGGADTGAADASGAGSAGPDGDGGAGRQVPAGSPLPECKPAAVELSLRTKVSYGPDDKPKFELIAKNTSSTTCKADFGPKNAVLTVTEAGGEDDDPIWSSKDCPAAAGPLFLKVPAGATVIHTVDWNRTLSAPGCATPPSGKAGPGTYLLEAKAPGEPVQRASFVLAKD